MITSDYFLDDYEEDRFLDNLLETDIFSGGVYEQFDYETIQLLKEF